MKQQVAVPNSFAAVTQRIGCRTGERQRRFPIGEVVGEIISAKKQPNGKASASTNETALDLYLERASLMQLIQRIDVVESSFPCRSLQCSLDFAVLHQTPQRASLGNCTGKSLWEWVKPLALYPSSAFDRGPSRARLALDVIICQQI